MPVYLIDDDADMLASTLFLLDSVGVAAVAYSDPVEFLQDVQSLTPGCVLTDLRMPALNGLELFMALRQRGIFWPVVVMSGHADNLTTAKSEAGIVAMVEKPFSLEGLMEAIGRAYSALGEPAPQASRRPAA